MWRRMRKKNRMIMMTTRMTIGMKIKKMDFVEDEGMMLMMTEMITKMKNTKKRVTVLMIPTARMKTPKA